VTSFIALRIGISSVLNPPLPSELPDVSLIGGDVVFVSAIHRDGPSDHWRNRMQRWKMSPSRTDRVTS